MENMRFYTKYKEVPETAKREIKGGRLSGKTDINPMWRIKALTELFGPCGIGWYYVPTHREFHEGSNGTIAIFQDIELFYKEGEEWSKPVSGSGGSMFVAKETNSLFTNDEAIKMATTDAISVAAKELGIGADVYWEKDKTKYAPTPSENKKQEQQQKKEAKDQEFDNLLTEYKAKVRRLTGDAAEDIAAYFKAKHNEDIYNVTPAKLRLALRSVDRKLAQADPTT